jgi:hypothetical protein
MLGCLKKISDFFCKLFPQKTGLLQGASAVKKFIVKLPVMVGKLHCLVIA